MSVSPVKTAIDGKPHSAVPTMPVTWASVYVWKEYRIERARRVAERKMRKGWTSRRR